ncbi:class I SAM-dependent methyltransferase [Alteriqipengyuania lutimaris]|uniref:Class I SAM-dependent methyltransferase n=1 Tax=Alteriqipengyuania lutimaris TaxID=1538146 RepID=A0A395LIJ9_9SPHN|nr:class I SAM-dependent methyltransferase [Alteriqipengyuania lutimaris]MBB3034386.1 ubiquinone/menaquinone biosynthesis C-methylase UbiE [Alteriqipengyuania lutimaris]RDS76712.1 class I SAM-dependent methyltransferase [Alteriqipengyuania lutimaris]
MTIFRQIFIAFARVSKRFSRENLYEWLTIELDRLPEGSKVLCIGGGGGLDGMIARHPATDTISIDIDPDRKPDMVMDATQMTFADDDFDAVFMMEVLEHVREPQAALSEIERVLKPGGPFVLSTPFVFGIHEEPWDYWRFTRHGLEELLRSFEVERIAPRNYYYRSIIVQFMRTIFSPGRKRQVVGMFAILVGSPFFLLLMLLDKIAPDDRSTTGYFAVAKKRVAG